MLEAWSSAPAPRLGIALRGEEADRGKRTPAPFCTSLTNKRQPRKRYGGQGLRPGIGDVGHAQQVSATRAVMHHLRACLAQIPGGRRSVRQRIPRCASTRKSMNMATSYDVHYVKFIHRLARQRTSSPAASHMPIFLPSPQACRLSSELDGTGLVLGVAASFHIAQQPEIPRGAESSGEISARSGGHPSNLRDAVRQGRWRASARGL
jgi:hypothetical protein